MPWDEKVKRRLKLRDLDILMTVIQAGSMGKAADLLNIFQPTVSKSIADLEHTLGVRLLDRNPQGVEPTPYALALIRRSAAAFNELKHGVEEIENLADPASGELRIAGTEAMIAGVFPAVIDRLSRQYPQLVYQLELCTTPAQQFHVLRERKCDLVVARIWSRAPEPDMDVETLFDDQVFVVAGRRNKWRGRRQLALAELVDEHWLLAPIDNEPGSPVFEIFRACGLDVPRARVLSYSLNVRTSLLATGRFLAIIPASVLRLGPTPSVLEVLPCALPPSAQPVAVTTLKNRMLSPTAKLFIERAREIAGPLAKASQREAVKPQAKAVKR